MSYKRPASFKDWAARHGERFIPETEYREATAARRAALAEAIRASGLSHSHIANGTRISRKTIGAAARGEEVRQDAHDRIHYYLQAVADRIAPEHTQGFATTTTYDGQTIETK